MWLGLGGSASSIVWSHTSSGALYKPDTSDSLIIVEEEKSPLGTSVTSNLKIKTLRKSDEGSFSCHAGDSANKNSSQVKKINKKVIYYKIRI